MHRSLWAYDPDNEEQLLAVLAAEYNCLRDLRPQPVLDALQRLAGEPLADPLPLEH